MRLRSWIAALTASVLMALPLAAADAGPAAMLQTASAGKILKDVREAAGIVAGEHGPKAIDDFLKTSLGEKGFSGLDLAKPILGYMIFDEKDAEKTRVVMLVPIAKQDDFLDFLKRCRLEPEEQKDAKGLYKLGSFDIPQADKPLSFEVLMRIIGTTAYIGFNVKADALDPAKVFKAEQIFDAKETALLAYKQFNDRIAPEVLKGNLNSLDEMMKKLKEGLGGVGAQETVILSAVEKLTQSMTKMSVESKETGSRLTLDTTTGELGIDSYYTPKAGTEFAKTLAARKPTMNQFAGLAGPETVAGLMVQMPLGMKEVQDLAVVGLQYLQEKVKEDPPPPFAKELVDETLKGVIRTVKSGNWDIAATMNGPDKDGHFTFCAGMTFDDPRPIEKALKANMKDFPAEVREAFKFDVDKVSDLDMHAIDPPEGPGEPPGYARVFGDRKIYFVFGPKGVYVAIGNGAKDALKAAINAKPAPANAFDVLVNPKRLGQLITAVDAGAGAMAEKIVGNEDKTYSAYTLSITGGDALRIKLGINLKILPRFMAMSYLSAFGN